MVNYYSLDPELSLHPVTRWEEIMSEVYYKLDIKSDRKADLTGTIEEHLINELSLTKFNSDRQRVLRSRSKIATDTDDSYVFVFPLMHDLYFEQLGRNGFVKPGGYVMVRTSEFYELACPDNFRNVTLKIPTNRIEERYPYAEDHCSCRYANNPSLSFMLRSFLVSLSQIDEVTQTKLAGKIYDQTLGLLHLLLEAERSDSDDPKGRSKRLLFMQVVQHIRSNLDNPRLNPSATASCVGISRSYMDRLLNEHSTSFRRKLRELRLQRSYERLADSSNNHLPISEIAYTSGFTNVSHFTRSFKELYALTPKQVRDNSTHKSSGVSERV